MKAHKASPKPVIPADDSGEDAKLEKQRFHKRLGGMIKWSRLNELRVPHPKKTFPSRISLTIFYPIFLTLSSDSWHNRFP